MAISTFEQLRQKALRGDVSWDANRIENSIASYDASKNYGFDPEKTKLVMHSISGDFDAVRGLGHAIEAKRWLESTTDEKMEYGTASRSERFEKAAEHAAKAGVALELIAETWDLFPKIESYDSWEGNVPMALFQAELSKIR
jgi:hypothetical protein